MFPMESQLRIRSPKRPLVSTSISSWFNFSPLSLSPSLWLDASMASSITSTAGKVSQWNDLSGKGFHVSQATAANQPTTGSSTINGYNAISFDGNDNLDRSGTSQIVNTVDGTYTAFAVFRPSTLVGAQGLVSIDKYPTAGTRSAQILRIQLNDVNTVPYPGGSSAFESSGTTLSANTTYIGSTVVGNNIAETFVNGMTDGPTIFSATLPTVATPLYVGKISADLAYYLTGLLGEVIVFPRTFTRTEHNMVGVYLSKKWNLNWRTT